MAAQTGVTAETLVVDNASVDGTLNAAKGFKVRLLVNRENIGYGWANNQAFMRSGDCKTRTAFRQVYL